MKPVAQGDSERRIQPLGASRKAIPSHRDMRTESNGASSRSIRTNKRVPCQAAQKAATNANEPPW